MAERVPPRDYQNSRAVLVGTSRYDHLGQVPAAEHSLRRMTALLTGPLCGWPRNRVTTRLNWRTPATAHQRLIEAYKDAGDVALFYFVGHAQPDDNDALCLGLPGSSDKSHLRAASSLDFADVCDALIRSPASTKIVLLDCCAGGLGGERTFSLGSRELASRTDGLGGYILAAAPGYEAASYETAGHRPLTSFTRHLAEVITAGVPGGPPELRLHVIYLRLCEVMEDAGLPLPAERSIDQAGEFVFASNAAAERRPGSRRRSPPPPRPPSAAVHQPRSAELLGRASMLLRQRRFDAFRQVDGQLKQLGLAARPTAVLATSSGDISIELLPDYAPAAVRDFIERARPPLRQYDGTQFHRVEPGRVIQGGEHALALAGTSAGAAAAGPDHHLPFDRPYLVGLATAGAAANGSQFFITLAPLRWLTGQYPVIGRVVAGQAIADAISQVPAAPDGRPLAPVRIEQVTIAVHLPGWPEARPPRPA